MIFSNIFKKKRPLEQAEAIAADANGENVAEDLKKEVDEAADRGKKSKRIEPFNIGDDVAVTVKNMNLYYGSFHALKNISKVAKLRAK